MKGSDLHGTSFFSKLVHHCQELLHQVHPSSTRPLHEALQRILWNLTSLFQKGLNSPWGQMTPMFHFKGA